MAKPRDTSKTDPAVLLADAMVRGGSESIEASEARGQKEVVESDTIPTKGADEDALESLGFTLGPVDEGDSLFRSCSLPDGWSREGSSHSMWSYIVDEKKRRRIAIFYKAAFYDRKAHMSIMREPATRAQEDAADVFHRRFGTGWRCEQTVAEDVLEIVARKIKVDDEGKTVYDHDNHDWVYTGEKEIARFDLEGNAL